MADPTMTGQGKLIIQATTARDTLPVQGAVVTVSEASPQPGTPPTLLYSAVTDNSGRTPVFDLAAPPRSASKAPGGSIPSAKYAVQLHHPSYQPVNIADVTVFDGVVSTLPVFLLPSSESSRTQEAVEVIPPPPIA